MAQRLLIVILAGCVAANALAETIVRKSSFAYDASGLLVKEVIEPDDTELCLVTEYAYDGFGNKTSATTRNCNGSTGEAAAPASGSKAVIASRTSTTSYAGTTANPVAGQFPTSGSNALSHAESREFDARFGAVTKLTGPNNLVTLWTYDALGRKSQETRADGTTTTWAYSLCASGGCPTHGTYAVTVTTVGRPTVKTYYDSLNREIRTESTGFDGRLVQKDTEYDALGRVLRVSRPRYAGDSPVWSTVGYDILGRVTTQSAPGPGGQDVVTTTTYNGLTTTVTNPLGQTETRVKNSQGQLVQVTRQ